MPFLDVTQILTDPDFASRFSVRRRTDVVDAHGRSVPTEQLIPGVIGVVTANSPSDLDRKEDYQTMSRSITVVCKFALRGETTNFQPDIIVWRGSNFLVKHVDLYPHFGPGFFQAECSSMDKTDKALIPGQITTATGQVLSFLPFSPLNNALWASTNSSLIGSWVRPSFVENNSSSSGLLLTGLSGGALLPLVVEMNGVYSLENCGIGASLASGAYPVIVKPTTSSDFSAMSTLFSSGQLNAPVVPEYWSGIRVNGKPWQQQYDFNNLQSSELTPWYVAPTAIPGGLGAFQAIVTNSRVYLLGGINSNIGTRTSNVLTAPLNSDGTFGEWAFVPELNLPIVLAYHQALVIGHLVYVLGGLSSTSYVNTIYSATLNLDGTLNPDWTLVGTLPTPLGYSCSAVISDCVYLFGGYNGSTDIDVVYKAKINSDCSLGSFSASPFHLPVPLEQTAVAVTGSKVYLLGGYADNAAGTDHIYTATRRRDGSLGPWTTDSILLPHALEYGNAVIVRDRIYIIGGCFVGWDFTNYIFTTVLDTDGNMGLWESAPGVNPVPNSQALISNSKLFILGAWTSTSIGSGIYCTDFIGGKNDYRSSGFKIEDTEGESLGVLLNGGALPLVVVDKSEFNLATNGQPWVQQPINSSQINVITSWSEDLSNGIPETLTVKGSTIISHSRIYILGAWDGIGAMKTLWAPIDSSGVINGSWAFGYDMPNRRAYCSPLIIGNKVYIFGGADYTGVDGPRNDVISAIISQDGSLSDWVTETNRLPKWIQNYQPLVTRNKVYLFGGNIPYGIGGSQVSNEIISAPLDQFGNIGVWQVDAQYLPASLSASGKIVTPTRVYLVGGYNGDTGLYNSVFYAPLLRSGALGDWQTDTDLSSSISGAELQCVATESRAYILNGDFSSGHSVSRSISAPIVNGVIREWVEVDTDTGKPITGKPVVTSSLLYLLGGPITEFTGIFYAPFEGGFNDYSGVIENRGISQEYSVLGASLASGAYPHI